MQVILIMLLATVGTVALILMIKSFYWSMIYLFKRIFKKTGANKYEKSTKRDILAIIIAILGIVGIALLLIYGLPIIIENKDWFDNILGN